MDTLDFKPTVSSFTSDILNNILEILQICRHTVHEIYKTHNILIMFSDLFVDRCTYDVPLPALLNVDGRMAYAATQLGSARMGHVQMTSKIFEFETSFPCHHFSYKNLPSYGHL